MNDFYNLHYIQFSGFNPAFVITLITRLKTYSFSRIMYNSNKKEGGMLLSYLPLLMYLTNIERKNTLFLSGNYHHCSLFDSRSL